MKAIKYLLVIIFCFYSLLLHSQSSIRDGGFLKSETQSYDKVENKQYKISIVGSSGDMQWVAVKKWYYKNSDTIMIFHRQNSQRPSLILTDINSVTFIDKDKLLAVGEGKAVIHQLNSHQEKEYRNIRRAEAIKVKNGCTLFAIHYQDNSLEMWRDDGNMKNKFENVTSLQAVKGQGFLIRSRNRERTTVQFITENKFMTFLNTNMSVNKLMVTDDGSHAVIDERSLADGNQNMSTLQRNIYIIELHSGKSSKYDISYEDFDDYSVSRIGLSASFLLSLQKKIKANNELLEIWYTRESNIKSLYQGKTLKKFYILNSSKSTFEILNGYSEEMFVTFTNNRYLLHYHPHQGHDYVYWKPRIKIFLYDTASKTEFSLGIFAGIDYKSPQVIYSPDGHFILGSTDRLKWNIWNLKLMKNVEINEKDLGVPVFAKNSKEIYFNSNQGIRKYNLINGKISTLTNTAGNSSIVNIHVNRQFNEYNFSCQTIDTGKPFLIKNIKLDDNSVKFSLLNRNCKTTLIPETDCKISDLLYNQELSTFLYLSENYNKPQQLMIKYVNKNASTIYNSNTADKEISNFNQEIITYCNSQGKSLKGTLYYPLHFDASKKYPMVVKVYQNQRANAKEYLIGGYISYVGYDKRTLIENGYFIYEPDVVFGAKGTGVEALDCLNHAMDALHYQRSIDLKRIALIGHSHGGYITNYIATQSNRFATYISGAGNSDLVRSYFSYNRNFHTPFYMQYETGQYEMPLPFFKDKELYMHNSPINYVEQVNAPMLLWAGKKDENIFWEQVQEFYIGLKRNNKDAVALFYTDGDHSLSLGSKEKEDLYKRSLQWFDYFLKDKKDVPWIDKQMKSND